MVCAMAQHKEEFLIKLCWGLAYTIVPGRLKPTRDNSISYKLFFCTDKKNFFLSLKIEAAILMLNLSSRLNKCSYKICLLTISLII